MATLTGLEIEIFRKSYPPLGSVPMRRIFEDFHLTVAPGAFVCLLGPSGIGKTTLLNMISGLDTDYSGRIAFQGAPAPRVGYVFQTPRLLPWRTVHENILLPLASTEAARKTALDLLARMGMSDTVNVYPERLSLGMQRRVALARAFAIGPDILLMDEPFVSLDEATADRLRDLLIEMLEQRPATVLFVTHDSRDAIRMANRIIDLSGAPAQIVKDIRVGLSQGERRDTGAIEAFRGRYLAQSES
jgi:ABC-type nitrate/sulfonate/bicarbonate transport system ATPase subunit